MARITRAAAHLPVEEVKKRMTSDPHPLYRQRWLIIYNALVEPRKAEEIARHCGISKATVHAVISSYNRLGIAAVETGGKGGQRSGYLSLEEERAFLTPFGWREQSGENWPRRKRSGTRLKLGWGTRSMIARSTGCSPDMAGAS
jgi:hypothetical protein